MKVLSTTKTTELNHTITPLFSRIDTSSIPDKYKSSAAVTHSVADHSEYLRKGISPLAKREESGLLRLDSSLKNYLTDRVWGRYFKSKIYEIEKLETELTEISGMDTHAWEDYRFYHCPNIKSKNGLILHIYQWQDHYRTQITNVLSTLKNAN